MQNGVTSAMSTEAGVAVSVSAKEPELVPLLPRVLLVDDDPNLLEGLRRTLRGRCRVETAVGPRAAIAILEQDTDFAVVVSDLRMPDVDGVVLLNQIRDGAPDIVRVLLTGEANTSAAIRAVNEGEIFRFLTKPCSADVFRGVIAEAVDHHRARMMEGARIDQLLRGGVALLTDVLALAQPAAYQRGLRLQRHVAEVAARLAMPGQQAIELAAMLSQIGYVSLSPNMVARLDAGAMLDAADQALVDRLPVVTDRLLSNIVGLEEVRALLRHASRQFAESDVERAAHGGSAAPAGAYLMRIVLDFDALESQAVPPQQAIARLQARTGMYDPSLLAAFADRIEAASTERAVRIISLADVREGMVFAADVVANDLVLVARGQTATNNLVSRIRDHWASFAASFEVMILRSSESAETESSAQR